MLIVAVLVCGLAASCFVIGRRARVESANNTVEITVDYTEMQQIAASTNTPIVEVLKTFKKSGAVSVAVPEETVGDLIDSHRMVPYGQFQFGLQESLGRRVASRLQSALKNGSARVKMTPLPASRTCYVTVSDDVPLTYLRLVTVGLPEEALVAARHAGLAVTARLVNYPGVTPEAITGTFEYLNDTGIRSVIFQGDQVLGFKGGVKYTAAALKKTGMVFGRVEFSRQKGEMELARKAPADLILVHSIPQMEMPNLDAGSIVERFQRAARERGVRLCYVRMYDTSSSELIASNAAYLSKISRALAAAGFSIGDAPPVEKMEVPPIVRIVAGAGVGAGAALLILAVVDLSTTAAVLWGVGLIAACAGLAALGGARNAVALLAAMTFPTLAVLMAVRSCPEAPTSTSKPLLKALGRVAVAVLIAVIGGALVVGLLSERSYMLRTIQFQGVKLAHLAPILALAFLFGGGIAWKCDTWDEQKRRLAARLREIGSSPMMMWQAGLALVLLVVFGFMVARSGNEPGVGVSELELKIRAILDKLLYVRPRTKEFLIGYPALLVGLAFAVRGFRRIAAPLIVVGAIALISALNSFCHIHTPLLLSAIRVANGAIFGCAVGVVVYWLVRNAQEWGQSPVSKK
jgi:hypothetical protein